MGEESGQPQLQGRGHGVELPTEHSRLFGSTDTRDWGEASIQIVGICVRASLRWDPSLFFK